MNTKASAPRAGAFFVLGRLSQHNQAMHAPFEMGLHHHSKWCFGDIRDGRGFSQGGEPPPWCEAFLLLHSKRSSASIKPGHPFSQ
jgi:hypothetical protein